MARDHNHEIHKPTYITQDLLLPVKAIAHDETTHFSGIPYCEQSGPKIGELIFTNRIFSGLDPQNDLFFNIARPNQTTEVTHDISLLFGVGPWTQGSYKFLWIQRIVSSELLKNRPS